LTHLLEVSNLKTYFSKDGQAARAVDGVSFHVDNGEVVGIVGESGSGKTVTALSILQLIPAPTGRIIDGKIFFKGTDLLDLPSQTIRSIRGNNISMIFQDPLSSLNPVFTIGDQISEAVRYHLHLEKSKIQNRVLHMLEMVGIPDPKQCYRSYPHQLSGGLRQRAMIAMALVCEPDLLIADEPTTALDVTVQAQILELLRKLQRQLDMSVLFISHDFGVIAGIADRVLVMYAGQIIEYGRTEEVFENPLHPYTVSLLESIPALHAGGSILNSIPGTVPDAGNLPSGCRFHPRCQISDGETCIKEMPSFVQQTFWNHTGRCHYIHKEGGTLRAPIALNKN